MFLESFTAKSFEELFSKINKFVLYEKSPLRNAPIIVTNLSHSSNGDLWTAIITYEYK